MLQFPKKNLTLFILLFYALFICARVLIGGGFSFFIVAGSDFIDPSIFSNNIIVQDGQGYDGQFFYRYALNPFSADQMDGFLVDLPAYRHQRIVYPLLAWLFSFGYAPAIPLMLIIVNFAFIAGTLFFLKKLLNKLNIESYYILLFAILPGVLMSLGRNLSEIAECFFLVASIYFILNKKYFASLLFITGGLLTRETSVIFYIPLVIWVLYSNFSIKNIFLLAIPFCVLILWQLLIYQLYPNYQPPKSNITYPFVGLVKGIIANISISGTKAILQMLFYLAYLFSIGYVLVLSTYYSLKNRDFKSTPFPIMIIFGVVFASVFSESIYIDDWAFVRILTALTLIAFIFMIQQKLLRNKFLKICVAIVFLTTIRLLIKV